MSIKAARIGEISDEAVAARADLNRHRRNYNRATTTAARQRNLGRIAAAEAIIADCTKRIDAIRNGDEPATDADITAPSYVYCHGDEPVPGMFTTTAQARKAVANTREEYHGEATIDRTTGIITLHLGNGDRDTLRPSTPQETAAHAEDLTRSLRRNEEQAAAADAEAKQYDEKAKTATGENGPHFARTRASIARKRAKDCREYAALLAADLDSLNPAPTAVIKVPGKFADWWEGTGVAQGQDDSDPQCRAARIAVANAPRVRSGSSSYNLMVTATAPVLDLLAEYAVYCLDANADEPIQAEVNAARKLIERTTAALATLNH